MTLKIFLLSLLSCLLSWILIKLLIPKLKSKFIDIPNERSSHKKPIPKGGGLVIILVSTISSLILGNVTPLICCPLGLIGLIDDYFNLPALWRYGFQLLTVISLLKLSPIIKSLGEFPIIVWLLILIACTGIINFTNFMDGLDGLIAGCMLIVFIYASIKVNSNLWIFVGSILGFLKWNWSPAKIFMGDSGSTFLGAIFTSLLINSSSWEITVGFLLIASPLLSDACICVIRRGMAGHSIFRPHKLHLYQRLNQANWSHSKVSLLYCTSTASIAICLLIADIKAAVMISIFLLLVGIWLDQKIARPFLIK